MSNSIGCSFSGCINTAYVLALCHGHYGQTMRKENLRPLRGSVSWHQAKLDVDGNKQCSKCSRWLPLSNFFARKDASDNNTYRAHCRKCSILRKYGITATEYYVLLAAQHNGCAICGITEQENGRDFSVDHDHRHCPVGKGCKQCIRGLLCQLCNDGIGRFKDNPSTLRKAAEYIERQ